MADDFDRPGPDDLVTPFLFVPHGSPDPVEWKRQHRGWVSFPATFVPHPRPIPKWKVINGQRWPLDKRGRPWPKTRYGRPTCPFDQLPPGMPAPGTQYELLRKLENPTLFWEGKPTPTVEEFSLIAARARAERAAAAPPPPIEPPRAYDGDGLGPARDYLNAMKMVDQQLREFAVAARQREAARRSVVAETVSAASEHSGEQAFNDVSETPPHKITAASLPTASRVMTDASPEPILEGRQYAAVPFALVPAAIELAPAAAALGALLGIGAAGIVLNEARKPSTDVTPRPPPIAVPPPREGESLPDVLKPGGQSVGEAGSDETIRELPGGEAAAEELFDRLSKGGIDVTPPGYPGRLVRMPDGTHRGYRSKSSDDKTPTIDVGVRGFGIRKLKFPGG